MRMPQIGREMAIDRPPLRQPVRVRRTEPRVPIARGSNAAQAAPAGVQSAKSWRRERRRGAIAAVTVAFLLGALLSGYGIHTHMSQLAARVAARDMQIALATGAALQSGMVLFVPQYGNVCRRRWIDNETWTIRDGGDIACDSEVSWNATLPVREYKIERRLDAIRNVFQSKTTSKVE
jgi:hypothetical protein